MSIKFYNKLDIDSASNSITSNSTSTNVSQLYLNNSGTGDASLLVDAGDKFILGVDNSKGLFRITSGAALGTSDIISMKGNGDIMFDQYGAGSFTGTEKYNLQIDSNGNIIETDAINDDVISGTGTANQVPKFQSDHVLIDSGLEIDASQNALFPANLNVGYTTNNGLNAQVAFKKSDNSSADANSRGVIIDYNLSGSTVQTGDRYYEGLFIDADSSATGGDTTNEIRFSGIRAMVEDSGDANDLYGGYFDARNDKTVANDTVANVFGTYSLAYGRHTAGEVKNIVGVQAYAYTDNASSGTNVNSLAGGKFFALQSGDSGKTVNNAYGIYGKVDLAASSNNGTFTNADGVYGEVEIDDADATISAARAVRGVIDSNAGTITSAYQFYGTTSAAGTITNNWGIYSQNATKNYLDGTLQLGSYSAGTLVTDASGNITVSSGGGAGGPYLPLAGGTMTGVITMPNNTAVTWSTGSIRVESSVLKLVGNNGIQLQDATQIYYDGGDGQVGIDIHNTGSATGDDAKITFETQGQYDYIIGIDRSASKFKISRSDAFGTNDVISLDSNSDVLFASDIEASGVYVGATNTSYDFYNNGTSYLNGNVTIDADITQTTGTTATFSGQVLCNTNTTTPTSGDAVFYKSSAGAVLSGYQAILETGSAGSRATALTIDNSQNATFAGDILMPEFLKHSGDTDTYYSFSASDTILESAGGDKGYTHQKNVITLGPTGASTSTMYFDLANRKVGFRTESPGSAFDVNGTARVRNQLNVGHTTEQNLYVNGNGSAGGQYVKMGNYGVPGGSSPDNGNYFGITGTENQPKYCAAFGNGGKIVQDMRIITIKLSGDAFKLLSTTGTTLIPAPGTNSLIIPYEFLVHNTGGTAGNWSSTSATTAAIGFCDGANTCGYPAQFNRLFVINNTILRTNGSWYLAAGIATTGKTMALNKPLLLKAAQNLTTVPTGTWYIQIRYQIINKDAGLINNVDITKTTN
jgi:hypothetical protein